VVDVHEQDGWIPRGRAQWWAWVSIPAGWILTSAIVAPSPGCSSATDPAVLAPRPDHGAAAAAACGEL
jgi:hypothetical protein